MAIVLIIIGTIILVIGMTLAIKSIKPVYFNLIAGIIILIGSLFGLFGKQIQDASSSEKSDKILSSSTTTGKKVENLQNQIEKQAVTIDELRRENTDLYGKLAFATKENEKQILGDGMPTLSATFHPDKLISLVISNPNIYPIYDIRLTFPDPDQAKVVEKMAATNSVPTWEEMRNNWINVAPFNLSPKSTLTFYNFNMPASMNSAACFTNIVTRNGTFSGRITITRNGESFEYTTEVSKAKPF